MQLMLTSVRQETRVWALLDQVDVFLNEHALVLFVGVIFLTVFGGVWWLWRLRRWSKSLPPHAAGSVQVGYGFVLSPNSGADQSLRLFAPPPPAEDDLRD